MTRLLKLWYWRLDLFLGIVWRPCTGPAGTEVWTWRDHWNARISVRTAWGIAMVIHDRPGWCEESEVPRAR